MKLVTIEEHVLDPAVARASAPAFQQLSPYFGAAFDPASGLPNSPSADVLCDLDEGRIADMDKHGITMQVLSNLTKRRTPARPECNSNGSSLTPELAQRPSNRAGGEAAAACLKVGDRARPVVERVVDHLVPGSRGR